MYVRPTRVPPSPVPRPRSGKPQPVRAARRPPASVCFCGGRRGEPKAPLIAGICGVAAAARPAGGPPSPPLEPRTTTVDVRGGRPRPPLPPCQPWRGGSPSETEIARLSKYLANYVAGTQPLVARAILFRTSDNRRTSQLLSRARNFIHPSRPLLPAAVVSPPIWWAGSRTAGRRLARP